MAQKMTLSAYLAQRGKKAKALTRGEAALLGIPFPLQAGWPRRYGAVEIDEALFKHLISCAEVARRKADQRATSGKGKAPVNEPRLGRLVAGEPAALKVVRGFVLRQARRYRARLSAPRP